MSYKIIGKYIKDLNFNIPNPKTFFLLSKNISNYKINIDIKSTQVKQNIIEVLTSLSLTPIKDDFEKVIHLMKKYKMNFESTKNWREFISTKEISHNKNVTLNLDIPSFSYFLI